MGGIDRLRRITDLFVEGTELHLGDDEAGPVIVWINKLNPFQVQEALRDGQARRFMAIDKLKSSGEYDGMVTEVHMMPKSEVASGYVDFCSNEIYIEALDDVDIDALAKEQRESIERMDSLLDDADTPDDAPERDVLATLEQTWMGKLREVQDAKTKEKLREAQAMDSEELIEKFLEKWRDFYTRNIFEQESQVTQIYYAMRECRATGSPGAWEHTKCNHAKFYLNDRSEVTELPEELLTRVLAVMDQITTPARAAGNSDAPTSSSDSLELSSVVEAASTPSSPDETLSAAPSS